MRNVNTYNSLTDAQKDEIRSRYEEGKGVSRTAISVQALARDYGVTKRTIRRVLGKVQNSGRRGVRLDPDKVREIRAQWALPPAQRPTKQVLADAYGVHPVNIHYIVTGKTWRGVE